MTLKELQAALGHDIEFGTCVVSTHLGMIRKVLDVPIIGDGWYWQGYDLDTGALRDWAVCSSQTLAKWCDRIATAEEIAKIPPHRLWRR